MAHKQFDRKHPKGSPEFEFIRETLKNYCKKYVQNY